MIAIPEYMTIQNISTKKKYQMTKANWDKLGKNQKLFKVLDDTEEPIVKDQPISNSVTAKVDDKTKGDSKKEIKPGTTHKQSTKSNTKTK